MAEAGIRPLLPGQRQQLPLKIGGNPQQDEQMDGYKRSEYDDLTPGGQGRDISDRKIRVMKRVVTGIILVFVLISILMIYHIIRTERQKGAASEAAADRGEISDRPSITAADFPPPDLSEAVKSVVDQASVEILMGELFDEEARSALEMARSSGISADKPFTSEEAAAGDAVEAPGNQIGAESASAGAPLPPASSSPGVSRPETPSGRKVAYEVHTVTTGETLASLGERYGLEPETIASVNRLTPGSDLQPGTRMQIPDRNGLIYTVKSGDTLSEIAWDYGMGYLVLAEVNGLTSSLIRPGDRLFVPGSAAALLQKAEKPEEQSRDESSASPTAAAVVPQSAVRPTEGQIIVRFGERREDVVTGEFFPSEGIVIRTVTGTPVSAVLGGRVSSIGASAVGYGRHIVMQHESGIQTLYAHLDSIASTISIGAEIARGTVIASVGKSGSVLEPQLYFEVRKDGVPIDPETLFGSAPN